MPAGIFQALGIVAQLSAPYFFKLIIDEAIGGGDAGLLWGYAGLSAVALGLASFLGYLARWSGERVAAGYWLEMRDRAFRHVVGMPMARHGDLQAGELVARVQFDTYSLQSLYLSVFPATVELVVGSAVTVVAMLILAPEMTWVTLAALPLVGAIGWVFRDRVGPLTRRVARAQGAVYAGVTEGLNGLEALKTYDARGQFADQLYASGESLRDAQLGLARFQAMLFPLLNFAIALVLLGVLVVGGQMVIGGALSVGTLVAYYYYVSRSLGPIRGATGIVFGWHRATAAHARLEEIFSVQEDQHHAEPPAALPQAPAALEFQDVVFRYETRKALPQDGAGPSEEGEPRPVLNGVSFSMGAGQRVALLGPSGSGKSTLGKLVARLYDPQEGQISYGGVALRDFEASTWRSIIGYVGQEVFLFHGSIAENIRFGALQAVGEAEVERCARIARVDEIAALKSEGLHAQVGEKGVQLSGGQRKRVGLARALVRRPRILVIDQLAADLEASLCRAIFEDLRREFPQMAILHVDHRVPAGFGPHEVFWMEGGKVAAHVEAEETSASAARTASGARA